MVPSRCSMCWTKVHGSSQIAKKNSQKLVWANFLIPIGPAGLAVAIVLVVASIPGCFFCFLQPAFGRGCLAQVLGVSFLLPQLNLCAGRGIPDPGTPLGMRKYLYQTLRFTNKRRIHDDEIILVQVVGVRHVWLHSQVQLAIVNTLALSRCFAFHPLRRFPER